MAQFLHFRWEAPRTAHVQTTCPCWGCHWGTFPEALPWCWCWESWQLSWCWMWQSRRTGVWKWCLVAQLQLRGKHRSNLSFVKRILRDWVEWGGQRKTWDAKTLRRISAACCGPKRKWLATNKKGFYWLTLTLLFLPAPALLLLCFPPLGPAILEPHLKVYRSDPVWLVTRWRGTHLHSGGERLTCTLVERDWPALWPRWDQCAARVPRGRRRRGSASSGTPSPAPPAGTTWTSSCSAAASSSAGALHSNTSKSQDFNFWDPSLRPHGWRFFFFFLLWRRVKIATPSRMGEKQHPVCKNFAFQAFLTIWPKLAPCMLLHLKSGADFRNMFANLRRPDECQVSLVNWMGKWTIDQNRRARMGFASEMSE